MIVSWNWLSEYVRLEMPVEELTERLALAGLNHESTEDVAGDLAIDLEVTSNRSDCLGHIGVAREISVLFDVPLRLRDPRPRERGSPVERETAVTVDEPILCPRFTARVVSGTTVKESPWWLRKRLETLGVRPISNVVDVTNYVMFECGQPLHAYDLDRLAGRRLVVRKARPGETIRAINNRVYELASDMLVIADAERPVGVAGVMGGLETEIGPESRNVLIEAAQFDAVSVRKTARALGLHSPSSFRFERPMDPEGTEWASRRCAELLLETGGGLLHPGVIDVGPALPPRAPITLRLDQIARVLGITIDRSTVERILAALGLTQDAAPGTSSCSFRPPSWRADLEREIDLIEEVARVHGYDHIPEDRAVPLTSARRGARERVEEHVRGALTGLGFDEAVTFSLVSDALAEPLRPGAPAAPPPLRVEHPGRKRDGALRQSLVPSLLAARRHNEAHGQPNAELFEIADVYLPKAGSGLPEQPARIGIVSGRSFLELKGVVETLLARLHAGALEAQPAEIPILAPGRTAELRLAGRLLGYLGEVGSAHLDALELRGACAATELDLAVLLAQSELVPQHHALHPFPAVDRDLSLVVDRSVSWAELSAAVTGVAGETLESVDFLDTFRGGNIPAHRQSVHFGLRFRRPDRTLTGEEVESSVRRIVEACAERFQAELRG
jgi:phenylalanyl-tRNA synthetase beta chain